MEPKSPKPLWISRDTSLITNIYCDLKKAGLEVVVKKKKSLLSSTAAQKTVQMFSHF